MDTPQSTIAYSQLDNWTPSDKTIAVIGDEAVFHARLHQASLGTLISINPQLAEWKFQAVEATQENLREVIKKLHDKKVWGIVVTRPLKTPTLKLLTIDIMAKKGENSPQPLGSAEDIAERVGAVNLMTWRPNGYWGISTDGSAWGKALQSTLNQKPRGKQLVIVGAGAVARAVAVEALTTGCRDLWIGNRTQENAWDAVDQIVPSINMRSRSHTFNLIKPSPKVPQKALIINTLPDDARDEGNPALDLSRFDRSSLYFDCEISPSPSNKIAEELGMSQTPGAHMWAHQILDHIEILIGESPSFDFAHWTVTEAAASRRP